MIKKFISILLLISSSITLGVSQEILSNWRSNYYSTDSQSITLDSLSIAPSSVVVKSSSGLPIDSSNYTIIDNRILLEQRIVQEGDSILIMYRTLHYDFSQSYSKLDSSKIKPIGTAVYIGYDFDPFEEEKSSQIISSQGLDYDGSFSRGFSFGNNQSLVLNSNFNLQLAGDLGDDLKILAAISDENIPIQAAGNTQQLQEFDKVFIKLKKGGNSVTAGDYDLNRPSGYFMKYNKKLKGLSYNNLTELNPNTSINSTGSFAISRGKFSRNNLNTQEGNQGPYKLEGNNGERFLIVLAGTERIYIDGQLMERGLEYDYIIDYNQAEISFTPKRLITKDSRVIVEFEYSDQNYLRTIYAINSEIKHKKYDLYFNFFNEQDSKSTTGDLELDEMDIAILEASGDDPNKSTRSGVRFSEEGFVENRVMYKKVFEQSIQDSILVYSINPDSAKYFASFSEVGEGSGSYSIDVQPGANGRVYKWVGPGNGSYEPITRLIAPEKKQMFNIGTVLKPWKKSAIKAELSLSNLDLNRFSEVDNSDNNGIGVLLEYSDDLKLGGENKQWNIRPKLAFERIESSFNPLNPYRNAEFTRDWNLRSNEVTDENIVLSEVSVSRTNLGKVTVGYRGFSKESLYQGNKIQFAYEYDLDGFRIIANASNLSTDGFGETSNFFRPNLEISKSFKNLNNWRFSVYGEREKNTRKDEGSDDLNQFSFFYDLLKFDLNSSSESPFAIGFSYSRRVDFAPLDSNFEKATSANEYAINGDWNQGNNSFLSWNIIFRQLSIDNPSLTQEQAKNTVLGKLDYRFKAINGSITGNTNYTISSGQEVKREFVFQEVLPGEGSYIWIDADSNNIQTIDEFEIAAFSDEANYIKITVFNNEFVRTNRNSISQSLRIEPSKFWKDRKVLQTKGLKKFISRISTLSSLRLDQKSMGDNIDQNLNPFAFDFDDPSLVSFNSLISNTLFFNPGKPEYDWQLGSKNTQSKVIQINGFEQRKLVEYFTRFRLNIKSNTDIIFKLSGGNRDLDSELFDNRDFKLNFYGGEAEVNYRPTTNIRIKANYVLDKKNNEIGLSEASTAHDFGLELTYVKSRKSNLSIAASYVNVDYTGASNTSLELAMLEGLKKGNNYLWGVNYTLRLANNIDFNLNYDGRKTGTARIVHVARAQIKASF